MQDLIDYVYNLTVTDAKDRIATTLFEITSDG